MTIVAPVELARRPQWVAWRLVPREGEPKPTKLPFNARTGRLASTTDPSTWASFEEAGAFCTREHCNGVGYVLSKDDPYVGVDLDGCRDPKSGRIEPWAKEIRSRLNSYTEISPSGTGLRIFVKGELPPYGRRKGKIEIYSQARFLTITGDHVLGFPETIEDRTSELLAWHLEVFGLPPEERQNGHAPRSPVQLADADLLLKARSAENGAKFWAIWNGDYSGYGSQSEADLALISHLAFWTGPDPNRLDQLFRSSGLMREKWERQDYRDRTINKALEGKTEFYDPGKAGLRLGATERKVDSETGEVIEESPWRSLGELVRTAPDASRQLVFGLLWEGRTHWVYSGPGAGKTLTWIAILMHVAAGKTFCGREVVQGTVLLIEEDSPDSVISEYVQMLAEIYEFDLDTLPFYINRLRGIRITDEVGLENVISMIDRAPAKPLVVALDACERLVPSDKFSSKELEPLSRLFIHCQSEQITNVMIDHTRKPAGAADKPDPIDTLYGGRTKSAISDVMMHFSGAIKTQALITFPKFRGDEPVPITVSFDGSAGFTLKTGKPQLSESERQVMMVLNNSFSKRLSRAEIEEVVDVSANTVLRALRKLVELGWVDCLGESRAATYASSGGGRALFS
jgi:putative DNA primase/helicase